MTGPRVGPAAPTPNTGHHPPTGTRSDTDPRTAAPPARDGARTDTGTHPTTGTRTDPEPNAATTPPPATDSSLLARTPPADLIGHLTARLDATARAWLHRALDEAADLPGTQGPFSAWELRVAEAGRRCGARYADAARVLVLHAARPDPEALARVYHQGTAAERRAVLYVLPHLDPGPQALPLVEDALRTNDTRLLAAAVGSYAARHLDAHQWRHAVLKCLFTGVSVDAVADLERRARDDAELARMLRDHAAERTAAGRPVPADLHRVLTLADPTATPPAPAAPARSGGRGSDGKES
ncbi:hypothetical protein SZN_12953 [Streptomyces zinciresistens K42]|uniref:Sugar phosphate isomerase/epimerase n=1 Tax=Streptomyces zinciresistens K42 TaxID=700597 RepID=G2GAS3_9ACTN|nr:EboA domain-containing protein [Streptomyces zinciresistens]EGX59408.1 hypothetical protein SZN_12953 [Streptomyces zinciresistens K42]